VRPSQVRAAFELTSVAGRGRRLPWRQIGDTFIFADVFARLCCVFVMPPGGTEYHGFDEIRAFVGIAMSGRTHAKGEHKTAITNWFADSTTLQKSVTCRQPA
jgi:hypothetical protein